MMIETLFRFDSLEHPEADIWLDGLFGEDEKSTGVCPLPEKGRLLVEKTRECYHVHESGIFSPPNIVMHKGPFQIRGTITGISEFERFGHVENHNPFLICICHPEYPFEIRGCCPISWNKENLQFLAAQLQPLCPKCSAELNDQTGACTQCVYKANDLRFYQPYVQYTGEVLHGIDKIHSQVNGITVTTKEGVELGRIENFTPRDEPISAVYQIGEQTACDHIKARLNAMYCWWLIIIAALIFMVSYVFNITK